MSAFLRRMLKSAVYSNPGPEWLLRRLTSDSVRVVNYHRFEPGNIDILERQCRHYRKYYEPITLDRYVNALYGKEPWPQNGIVVTVDDGYRDVCTVAAPVFQSYQIPVTVYLIAGFLDRQCWLWWDLLSYAFTRTSKNSVTLALPNQPPATIAMDSPGQRLRLATECSVGIVRSESEHALAWIHELCAQLAVEIPDEPMEEYAPLTWAEARRMQTMGFTFGSHTVYHKILGAVRSYNERRFEVFQSKRRIEEQLETRVDHFCFPNGGIGDFSHLDIDLVREAGYRSAATTFIGLGDSYTDPFRLARISVNCNTSMEFFRMKVAGLWRYQGKMNTPMRMQPIDP
jgi:peptidoglycan/xylan/chitin deacetylase (PgdA/CDA1 family)